MRILFLDSDGANGFGFVVVVVVVVGGLPVLVREEVDLTDGQAIVVGRRRVMGSWVIPAAEFDGEFNAGKHPGCGGWGEVTGKAKGVVDPLGVVVELNGSSCSRRRSLRLV